MFTVKLSVAQLLHTYIHLYNVYSFFISFGANDFAKLAGVVEYTNCISVEG